MERPRPAAWCGLPGVRLHRSLILS